MRLLLRFCGFLFAAGTIVNWAYGKPFEVGGITSYRGSYHAGASSGAGTALVFGRLAGAQAVRARKPVPA